MRIALFGPKGQVGSALMARLSRAWTVIPLERKDVDLLVPGAVAAAIRSIQPDIVVNAAGWTAVDKAELHQAEAYRINRDAIREMAEAGSPWLISYSSDYVFDGRRGGAYSEDDMPAPLSVYGASKLGGEHAIVRASDNYLVFRTSWVHSPRHVNFVTTILRLAAERDFLNVVNDQIGAPTSATLIAEVTTRALHRIAEGNPIRSGIYHLAASGACSWYEYAEFIVQRLRQEGIILPCVIKPVSAEQYGQAALRPSNSRLDTAKLQAALGFAFPSWEDGARKTIFESLVSDVQVPKLFVEAQC